MPKLHSRRAELLKPDAVVAALKETSGDLHRAAKILRVNVRTISYNLAHVCRRDGYADISQDSGLGEPKADRGSDLESEASGKAAAR